MVLLHRAGHVGEDRGLAGLGRRDNEAALALADGRHQLHGARGMDVRLRLELDALDGIDAGSLLQRTQQVAKVRLFDAGRSAIRLVATARPAVEGRTSTVFSRRAGRS